MRKEGGMDGYLMIPCQTFIKKRKRVKVGCSVIECYVTLTLALTLSIASKPWSMLSMQLLISVEQSRVVQKMRKTT